MIPLKQFSDYFLENVSAGNPKNQIQITSVCSSKCTFCSNEQNPFKIERCKFRSVEEIEKIIFSTDFINGEIRLNDSLPGRISEGDALLHPNLFDILSIIRRKFSNFISLTTNGELLTTQVIYDLSKFNPVNINFSIPSLNRDNWISVFNSTNEKYNIAINALKSLSQYNINCEPALIPHITQFGFDDLEQTIRFLSDLNFRNMIVYGLGYTKNTNPKSIGHMKFDKNELSDFLDIMAKKYRVAFEWPLDPKKDFHLFDIKKRISPQLEEFKRNQIYKSYWFTSTAMYEKLNILLNEMTRSTPLETKVVAVENYNYGGNIECTGLWMIDDIKRKIEEMNFVNEYIVMPSNFLDVYGFDLNGNNIIDYFKSSENKIFLIK